MKVRYITLEDLDLVYSLFIDVLGGLSYYTETAIINEKKKFSVEELTKKLEEDSKSIIGVFASDKLIGFSISRFDDYIIWAEWGVVHKDFRKKGVGSILLEALEKSAKERNCHKIWCDSIVSNLGSFQLLQKHKFKIITTLEGHWYGLDFFLWEKKLR